VSGAGVAPWNPLDSYLWKNFIKNERDEYVKANPDGPDQVTYPLGD
jgi:hypothetical protein